MIGPEFIMLLLSIALGLFAVGYHYWAASKVNRRRTEVQASLDEALKDAANGDRILMNLALAHSVRSCDVDGCMVCGVLVCPKNDSLHFIRGGCPSCFKPPVFNIFPLEWPMSRALSVKHRELLAESLRALQVWGSMPGQYDLEPIKAMGDLRLVVMAQCGFDPLRRAHLLDYQRRIGWMMDRQQVLNGEPWPEWLRPYHIEAEMSRRSVRLSATGPEQIEYHVLVAMTVCAYRGEHPSDRVAQAQKCNERARRPIP